MKPDRCRKCKGDMQDAEQHPIGVRWLAFMGICGPCRERRAQGHWAAPKPEGER